jgi:hypothetical protein
MNPDWFASLGPPLSFATTDDEAAPCLNRRQNKSALNEKPLPTTQCGNIRQQRKRRRRRRQKAIDAASSVQSKKLDLLANKQPPSIRTSGGMELRAAFSQEVDSESEVNDDDSLHQLTFPKLLNLRSLSPVRVSKQYALPERAHTFRDVCKGVMSAKHVGVGCKIQRPPSVVDCALAICAAVTRQVDREDARNFSQPMSPLDPADACEQCAQRLLSNLLTTLGPRSPVYIPPSLEKLDAFDYLNGQEESCYEYSTSRYSHQLPSLPSRCFELQH